MSNADRCRRYQERRRDHVNMIGQRVDMVAAKLDALADRVNTLFEKFQQLIDHVNMVLPPNGPPLKKPLPPAPPFKEITPPLIPPSAANAAAADLEPDPAPDPIKELWDRGKAVLRNSKSAGSLIGKLRQQHGDVVVLQAIVAAETELPSEPASFLIACCNQAKDTRHGRLTPANQRFIDGRAATYRAVLAAEERDRAIEPGDPPRDWH